MTDKATEFIAEVAVRVIWFVVVYVSLPLAGILVLGLGVRTGNVSYEELNNLLDWAFVTSGLWIIFGVIAAVVAVIGPSLLRRDRMRGEED